MVESWRTDPFNMSTMEIDDELAERRLGSSIEDRRRVRVLRAVLRRRERDRPSPKNWLREIASE